MAVEAKTLLYSCTAVATTFYVVATGEYEGVSPDLDGDGTGAPWAIHLFSKAGFLSLARLLKRLDVRRLQEERAHGAPEVLCTGCRGAGVPPRAPPPAIRRSAGTPSPSAAVLDNVFLFTES